jgi:hypothetical protein
LVYRRESLKHLQVVGSRPGTCYTGDGARNGGKTALVYPKCSIVSTENDGGWKQTGLTVFSLSFEHG